MDNKTNEIVLFETSDGVIKLNVPVIDETVWLNRNQMADLFGRDVKTIGKHIGNALKEEVDNSTVAKIATVQTEGNREVERESEYYNLDMIISVGYRVKSQKGIEFRHWANKILKEYGHFTIHNMKLKPTPFEKIASGRKTVELRLYDEKHRKVDIGDRIIFTNLDNSEQKIAVKVIGLHRYATFEDLFGNISLEKCGNASSDTPEDAAAGMKKYYTDEQIKRYGVLGIEIKLADIDFVLKCLEEQQENEFERLFPDGMK